MFPPNCFLSHLGLSFLYIIVYNSIIMGRLWPPAHGGESMTRNSARELAVHLSFELSFTDQTADEFLASALTRQTFELFQAEEPLYTEFPNVKQREYISTLVQGVWSHRGELDGYIEKYAIGWKLSRINRVIVSILRTAMYEILYMQDIPNAAAIDAAVELTKHYEDPEIVSFVNGILGSFVRTECPAGDAAAVQTEATDPAAE